MLYNAFGVNGFAARPLTVHLELLNLLCEVNQNGQRYEGLAPPSAKASNVEQELIL